MPGHNLKIFSQVVGAPTERLHASDKAAQTIRIVYDPWCPKCGRFASPYGCHPVAKYEMDEVLQKVGIVVYWNCQHD